MPASPAAAEREGQSGKLTADLGHPLSPLSRPSQAPLVGGGETRGGTSQSERRRRALEDVGPWRRIGEGA